MTVAINYIDAIRRRTFRPCVRFQGVFFLFLLVGVYVI